MAKTLAFFFQKSAKKSISILKSFTVLSVFGVLLMPLESFPITRIPR